MNQNSSNYKIAIIPGDGIGPEVTEVSVEILEKLSSKHNFNIETKFFPFGGEHYLQTKEVLSSESFHELNKYDVIFLGALGHPKVKPGILEKGLLLNLRFGFDQYINLRPVKLYPGVETPLKNKTEEEINYTVVRENTGGLYTGVGGFTMKDTKDEVAIQSMVYNYKQVSRCIEYAYNLASNTDKKKLSLIGKTNVLTYTFDLWNRVFNDIGAKQYPQVNREYYHVDAACMHMVKNPEMFDIMVTSNMFGDIITDLGAITQGGMGLAASGNINPDCSYPSMFEPVHGSAPDIAGKNKANPLASVMSLKMMLEFIGEDKAAKTLDDAISAYPDKNSNNKSTTEIKNNLIKLI